MGGLISVGGGGGGGLTEKIRNSLSEFMAHSMIFMAVEPGIPRGSTKSESKKTELSPRQTACKFQAILRREKCEERILEVDSHDWDFYGLCFKQ